ncbi:MAG TPA: hypothetical protein VLT59_03965 [Steroidobacteraceae bacterium]|nr:hypothetical protein [Steroidobacteraceae bacterium]
MDALKTLIGALPLLAAGTVQANEPGAIPGASAAWQSPDALLAGEVMAVAYSGYREGQHPDRGDGAINPSRAEML